MQITWVFSAGYSPGPEVNLSAAKSIGPSWGSWKSWRACNTDNVICHDRAKARELLDRNFQTTCNFYTSKDHFQSLGRPNNVNLYGGNFAESVDNLEDIVAMHLVGHASNIVLLAGFDLSAQDPAKDRFEQHRIQNKLGLMYRLFVDTPNTQWVLVDHPNKLDVAYSELENITCDVMENVLQLLK